MSQVSIYDLAKQLEALEERFARIQKKIRSIEQRLENVIASIGVLDSAMEKLTQAYPNWRKM